MYEKPELVLVGRAVALVLGPTGLADDSEVFSQEETQGVTQGLDD